MWGALKSDFGEFVSTVATDTVETLAKIDTGLEEGEGQGVPLIDPDTGIPIDAATGGDVDGDVDDDNDVDSMSMKRPDQLTIEEKKVYLMTCEAVFTDDLIKESESDGEDDSAVKAFLEQFDIETKTEEISQLLEKYPGTLQTTFSNLSDQVEYADFWKRYFFRLSDEQVEATYEAYYATFVEKNEAAKKAGPSALSNVTNFLGGVVHRLVEENDIDDIDDDGDDDDEQFGDDENVVGAAASSAMNFLAGVGSGRPPFVLNTAVSDDDDDGEDGGKEVTKLEESDDEEELGWDDDDDDDDDGDLQDEAIEAGEEGEEETLEFKDAEKENLQEELQQAREERDILHKTVEMQTEEIKNLKIATQPGVVAGGDESKQVELLQMQLFEKDSELAALRAQLEDLKQEKEDNKTVEPAESQHTDNAEVERLNDIVGEMQEQISKLETETGKANDLQAELERTIAESELLQSQLTSLQQTSQDESALNEKDSEIAKLQQDLSTVQEKLHASTEQSAALKEGLKTAQMTVETSGRDADDLRTKLTSYEGIISQLRADLQRSQDMSKTRDSEDSDSTGVKVSASLDESPEISPPAPDVTKIDADAGGAGGENDDGWGDDW